MPVKALDLFQAYQENQLPTEGGIVVSSLLQEGSGYCRYEVVAYGVVKGLYLCEDALTFKADGNKLFVLVEPAAYSKRLVEPFRRDPSFQVPHRFSELEILVAKNQSRVMVSREPILVYSAFTILKPRDVDFAFLFYNLPDTAETITVFFEKTLYEESGIPPADASQAAACVAAGMRKFTVLGKG